MKKYENYKNTVIKTLIEFKEYLSKEDFKNAHEKIIYLDYYVCVFNLDKYFNVNEIQNLRKNMFNFVFYVDVKGCYNNLPKLFCLNNISNKLENFDNFIYNINEV